MDLSPLYDLRERLKAGAVAGTGLIAEDFRLKRSLDALAPLEAASPVFAKLGQGVRVLLQPDCPDRAAALLEALSLADAVLCTQATVPVPGELEPIPPTVQGAIINVPYSVLNPLMEALTNSGSGRYSIVMETHEQHPELFRDYRIKNAMVDALGASYNELADQVATWLSQEGEGIIPLLKKNFDPKGKKEMVRRLQVIESIAGAKANDFYISLLENAEKEVRCAAISALSHDEDNAELLVSLTKTEKGSAKKQAHWALAKLESPIAWDFWEKLAEKKPDGVADYMVLSTTKKSSQLVGSALNRLLDSILAQETLTKEASARFNRLTAALPGKSGPEICGFFRRAASLGSDWLEITKNLPTLLFQALTLNPADDLLSLAMEFYNKDRSTWIVPALEATLLTQSAERTYEIGSELLGGLFKKKERFESLMQVLGTIWWDEKNSRQIQAVSFLNPESNTSYMARRPLAAPLDPRWYPAIAKQSDGAATLRNLIQPNQPEIRKFLIDLYYDKTLSTSVANLYLDVLRKLNCEKCAGLAVAYCKAQKKLAFWSVENFFNQMPGSNEAKAAEAERILLIMEDGKFAFRDSDGLDRFRQMIAQLRSTAQ